MIHTFLLIATTVLFGNSSISHDDTVRSEQLFIEQQLMRDYDSLLMSFYVQKSLEDTVCSVGDTLFVSETAMDTTNIVVDLNDSTIMRQMSEMQVLFDVSYNHIVKAYIKVYSEKRELTETVGVV